MRSDTAPAGRVRLVITLSVISAVMVVAGGILVVSHLTGHSSSLGVALGVAGLAVGLVALLVFAFARGRRSTRRKPASHRRRAATSAAPGRERGRVLNPTTVYTPGGLIDVPRDVRASASEGAARTSGFSEPPRATRPAAPHGAREASRAATAPGPPRGGPGEARPSAGPGRMGAAPPRPVYPGYQAAPHPVQGPGWGPPGPPGPPGRPGRPGKQPMPRPPGLMRPGDAPPPREAFPPRDAPAFSAGPPRGAPPFRESSPPRPGPPAYHGTHARDAREPWRPDAPVPPRPEPPRPVPPRPEPLRPEPPRPEPLRPEPLRPVPPRPGPPPRHGTHARDARESWRPDAPVPPFEADRPSRGARPGPYGPGPGSGTGRPSAGTGYGPSAGQRPEPPGAPGGPGSGATFDGGYAQVIRSTDHPVPPAGRSQPNPGRPADPAHSAHPAASALPADRDVYVYRDASDPAPRPSARHAAADDAAYWYDLLAEDPAPQPEEARGPFEPLLSSSGTSGAPPGAAGRQPGADQAQPPRDEHLEVPEQARARKLEQLKDLYLTAEAIGEQNVDKHFDHLLAQQRELISEYFRQSAAAQPDGTSPRDGQAAETEPQHQQTGGQATPPEGVSVRMEPPRAW